MKTQRIKPNARIALGAAATVVLVAAMALDTKMVKVGSSADVQAGGFSADSYGRNEFPKVRDAIEKKAVDAVTLATAIAKDQDGAQKQYGVAADAGPEFAVTFTGKVGKKDEDSGADAVAIDGMPDTVHVMIQTGPAITGTDLRDGTGLIAFGQFSNQIDYQNAGSALNKTMKSEILSKIDTASLEGKTVTVVGVFQLTDPGTWLVTPVRIDVR